MVIVVDEPQGAFYASAVAAPVFSKVGHYALRILAVPPDGSIPPPDTKVRAAPATIEHLGEVETAAALGGAAPQPPASAETNPAVIEAQAEEAATEAAPAESPVSSQSPPPAAPGANTGQSGEAGVDGDDSIVAGLVAGGSPAPAPNEGQP